MPSWKNIVQKNMGKILETESEKEQRLHCAVNSNKMLEIDELLHRGVNVDCRGDFADWAPLHTAASSGHAEAIKLLIEFNATIDILDKFGNTPLFYALKNRHRDAVLLLLSKNASTTISNKWGETAMEFADKDFRALFVGDGDVVESFSTMEHARNGGYNEPSPSNSMRKKWSSNIEKEQPKRRYIGESVMESFCSVDFATPRRLSPPIGSPSHSHK